MGAKGLLAQLLVQPCEAVRKELANLGWHVLEVLPVIECMPPRIDQPPTIRNASGFRVGVHLQEAVLVGVAAGHQRVGAVLGGAVAAVGVALAVARVVVKHACRAVA